MLRGGATLPADVVILATGIVPRVKRAHPRCHPRVVDAWDECALATLPLGKDGRLLLLGSGLSALDVLAFLDAQGFAGEVTLISPRGLLPLSHEAEFQGTAPLSADDVARAPKALRPLVRWVRETIASAVAGGCPGSARSTACGRTSSASTGRCRRGDRGSFVRHVRPYWDVFRHRAPADALARVGDWTRDGRLRRIAGRVTIDGRGDPSSVTVDIRERSGRERRERFDAVVRCVGPALDVAEAATPLLQSLIDGGLATLSRTASASRPPRTAASSTAAAKPRRASSASAPSAAPATGRRPPCRTSRSTPSRWRARSPAADPIRARKAAAHSSFIARSRR